VTRRPGRTRRRHKPTLLTYGQVLGALLVEMWDARANVATDGGGVTTWTGVNGNVLTPTVGQQPAYSADGTNFKGLPVIQTTLGAGVATGLSSTGTFVTTGTRPWTFSVARFRTVPSVDQSYSIIGIGRAALSDNHYVHGWRTSSGATNNIIGYTNSSGAGGTVIGPLIDTDVHSFHYSNDGVNNVLTVDSTVYTTAFTAAVSANLTIIGVGRAASGTYHASNTSHALHILCSSSPNAEQIAALKNLAYRDFGAPV
jgi:hypothetical protein